MWSLLLYTAISIAAISFVWIQLGEEGRVYIHALLTASIISSVLSFWLDLESVSGNPVYADAFHMGTMTLIMVWITTVIWNLKPVYARYPIVFTWSPLLLLAGFPWIATIPSLMSLFFLVIESGILLILILIWISLYKRLNTSIWYLCTWAVGGILWTSDLIQLFQSMPWLSHLLGSVLLLLSCMMYRSLIDSIPELQK